MTRYAASAAPTIISRENPATTSSMEAAGTTSWSQARARMSSMAAMATIILLAPIILGSGTSSIAAKARTNTLPTITTMWTAVARRAGGRLFPRQW
jgi:hypothetical protein